MSSAILLPDGDIHNMDKVFMDGDIKGKEVKLESAIGHMKPSALQALHALVSLVHDRVNIPDPSQVQRPSWGNGSTACAEGAPKNRIIFHLEDDPVANTLWNIEPRTLRTMLLYMAVSTPRLGQCLLLKHCLWQTEFPIIHVTLYSSFFNGRLNFTRSI